MHRGRAFSVVVTLLCSTSVSVIDTPVAQAAGSPPACSFDDRYRQCNRYADAAPLGSIALLGDSVMLGSADGMSNPGLPQLLADAGWGPLNLVATLGMRTLDSRSGQRELSAWHWIDRWYSAGWHPAVVAVNLGANHLGSCTPTNTTNCFNAIVALVDKIGPGAAIWWAKVNQFGHPSGNPTSGMLGWNIALEQVASIRPNLVLWDWPSALQNSNPPISTDVGGIHPTSGAQYVKRSRLMADDITTRIGAAHFVGPYVDPAESAAAPAEFQPVPIHRILDTSQSPGMRLAADSTFTLDLSALAPPGAVAVALTLGSDGATSPGFLTAHACDQPRPWASNLNFQTGERRASQSLVGLSADDTVCIYALQSLDIYVDLQGWFVPDGGQRLHPLEPQRLLDSRLTGRATIHTISVPDAPGGGEATAVALSLVGLESDTANAMTVWSCDNPRPTAVQIYFAPGEVIAGALFVPVSAAGTVCVATTSPASIVVDITGYFAADDTGLRFTRSVVTRMLDTRIGLGGWIGRHGADQTISLRPAPPGAKAVSGTMTMVSPLRSGFQRANPCGGATPLASAVNALAGAVLANSITVGLSDDQQLCVYSLSPTDTLFDIAGWWT